MTVDDIIDNITQLMENYGDIDIGVTGGTAGEKD